MKTTQISPRLGSTLESPNLTNEERRSEIYGNGNDPTDSSRVTSKTGLTDLNLNWSERELQEGERTKHVHRLHPYLGKFIPQLVEVFLRKYFSPGDTVLDPFCGSGTTLVQANELGINSIGYDVSAFNILLCKAKTSKYDASRVRKEILDALGKIQKARKTDEREPELWTQSPVEVELPKVDKQYLRDWFAPAALSELLTYLALINSGGYEYQDLLKIILSRSARSARLTTHFDLDFPQKPQLAPYWCYKHSRDCKPTTEALKFIERYSLDTIERIEEFSRLRTDSKVTIRHADCRRASFPAHDGVITSPPYVGLIDYHEQHAYAYHLLNLHDKRTEEIGPAVNGSSQKAQQKYIADIATVFSRAAKSMRRGGRMIVVANDRANLYGEIANQVGMKVEAVVQRHVNRRTGRRSSNFFESIFIWRRP